MKKLFVFLLAVISLTLTIGCSTEDFPFNSQPEHSKNALSYNVEFQNILHEIDSINVLYDKPSRGSFKNGFSVTVADNLGALCGKGIGRWVGGAIGSLAGNPFTTAAGAIIGSKVGPYVVSAVASGIANALTSEVRSEQNKSLSVNYSFAFSDNLNSQMDSIGYYHNLCMVQIQKNHSKYTTKGVVDTHMIYDDIVAYYKSIGIYDPILENIEVKNFIVTELTNMGKSSTQCYLGKISENKLIEIHTEYLKSKVGLTDEEITIHKDFGTKIALQCSRLEVKEIQNYAKDVNKVIETSKLNKELKTELATNAQFIVNSSLCWQQ